MTRLRRLSLVPFFLFLAGACGGTTSTPDAGNGGGNDTGGGASPLVGSWFQQVTPATSDNQTITITFGADGTVSFVHTQVDSASSTTAGCTETCTTPGTYTATATTVTTTADTASSSQVNSGCTDPSQNGTTTATSCSSLAATFNYVIAADTLTLTDPSSPTNMIVLTRH